MDLLVLDRFVLRKEDQPAAAARTELLADEDAGHFYTIYVLGGSTSVGYPYAPEVDFGKLIGHFFGGRINGKPVRVVNLAGLSRPVDHSLKRLEEVPANASLILLHAGHNEYLARRRAWFADWHSHLGGAPRPFGRPAFPARTRRRVLEGYQGTLAAILKRARTMNVPIIVSTAACNQRDWPPNGSAIGRRRNAPRLGTLLRRASACAARGDLPGGAEAAQEALRLEPDFAQGHWLLGQFLGRQGRLEEASGHFQRAVDLDVSPTRSSSAENDALRAVCAEAGVPVVDLDALLTAASTGGAPGYETFDDNCHPNLEALATLAEGFCRVMKAQLQVTGDWTRPSRPAIERAFGIDQERKIRILAARVYYIFGATFVAGQWNTGPARAQLAELAGQLRALDPGHPQAIAARAISAALAGDTEGFAAAARAARAADETRAADVTAEGEAVTLASWLGIPAVQQAFRRYGMQGCLRAVGITPRPAWLHGVAVGVRRLQRVRRSLSKATLWLAYFALIVPLGRLTRLLGSRIISRPIDRDAASYWQAYTSHEAGVEGGPRGRSLGHLAVIANMVRRRRFVPAVVVAVVVAISFLLVENSRLWLPFVYTLF